MDAPPAVPNDPTSDAEPRDEVIAVQDSLPFEGDDPIPFRLTVRGRRAVAPETLPALRVVRRDPESSVGGPATGHSPATGASARERDTDRARARALGRAGVDPVDIASELGTDAATVAAWTAGVTPVTSAKARYGRRAAAHVGTAPATTGPVADGQRREAADEAAARLADPAFAAGVGLLAGTATIGSHAVVVRLDGPATAAAVVSWLRRALAPAPDRLRLLVRQAPQLAADRARHRWAAALDLPLERVTVTAWSHAPTADAVEATLRLADPALAARLAGWRDALLASLDGAAKSPAAEMASRWPTAGGGAVLESARGVPSPPEQPYCGTARAPGDGPALGAQPHEEVALEPGA